MFFSFCASLLSGAAALGGLCGLGGHSRLWVVLVCAVVLVGRRLEAARLVGPRRLMLLFVTTPEAVRDEVPEGDGHACLSK